MKQLFIALASVLFAGSASAQPVVNAVLNSASNALPGLPGSAVAQGSIFIAYGTGMGPASLVNTGGFPLSKTLGGTSAQITVNGTTVDAYMFYSSANQIAGILPSKTPVGTGTITVTYNGQISEPAALNVVTSSVGLYTLNGQGTGAAVATFADYSVIAATHPAHNGDPIVLWGTGLGPVAGDDGAAPAPGDMQNVPAQIYVGGQLAPLQYRGRSGCCAGLDQLVLTVPDAVQGCNVPVVVQVGDNISNYASIAVAPKGVNVCSDPNSPLSTTDVQTLLSKGSASFGYVSLSRTQSTVSFPGLPTTSTTTDDGTASFNKVTITGGNLPSFLGSVTSIGSCTVSTFQGTPTGLPQITSTPLDAGAAINLSGPGGAKSLAKSAIADQVFYTADLGTDKTGLYLNAGSYTATGPGGADVGAFTATITLPTPLVWTNEGSVSTVTRSAGQNVTWTGGDPTQYVTISGSSYVLTDTQAILGSSFTCLAKVSDGSFTIPAPVLLSLPATSTVGGFPIPGSLAVGSSTPSVSFQATGLDVAFMNGYNSSSTSVTYK